MIRQSKHTIKFANKQKQIQLESVVKDYKVALQEYVDLILSEKLSLQKFMSTKELPDFENSNISFNNWRTIVYQDASAIVRGRMTRIRNKTYKRYKYLYAKSIKQNKHSYFLNKKYSELNINYLKRMGKINIMQL